MTDLFNGTPADILSHHADADAVDSFIAYRKKHKRAALTDRGAMMLAKTLMDINAEGGDATEALDMAQEHGWQTIKKDWYFGQKKRASTSGHSRPHATTDAIAFAGSARRTPDKNCF